MEAQAVGVDGAGSDRPATMITSGLDRYTGLRRFLLLVPVVLLLGSACGSGESKEADAPPQAGAADESTGNLIEGTNTAKASDPGLATEVAFTIDEDGVTGPSSTPAGWTRIVLNNQGQKDHHLGLIRLTEGKTADDLAALMKADPDGSLPPWAMPSGGPADVSPSLTGTVTMDLAPGSYALATYVLDGRQVARPGADTLRPFSVTATGAEGRPPTHDIALSMFDHGYNISNTRDRFGLSSGKAIDSGPRIIKITNDGSHAHEARIVELPPNKQAKDFPDLYFMKKDTQGGFGGAGRFLAVPVIDANGLGPGGPPPGKAVGGTLAILPGETVYVTVNFSPSWHFVYDMLEDVQFGAPHLLRPMLLEYPVR